MAAYYNEIEPFAVEWLKNLISAGLIAPGEVDTRSIEDVVPDDLRGFTQCHFFAGIGLWSLALRWAGWSDDRPVWTGSCPCQPFSAAGKGKGVADERHLWPAFFHLIGERRPPVVFGEQVASKDGLGWLDLVSADLENAGYAVAAADLCAAGAGESISVIDADAPCLGCGRGWDECRCVLPGPFRGQEDLVLGAPHLRQRLWWGAERVEHAASDGREQRRAESGRRSAAARCGDGGLADADGRDTGAERKQRGGEQRQQPQDGGAGGLADAERDGRGSGRPGPYGTAPSGVQGADGERQRLWSDAGPGGALHVERMADAERDERGQERSDGSRGREGSGAQGLDERSGDGSTRDWPRPSHVDWRDADWLFCRDGKWRPVEPGTFPLAHGYPARVGVLRAYGNAIVPQVAAAFIEAWLEAKNDAQLVGF